MKHRLLVVNSGIWTKRKFVAVSTIMLGLAGFDASANEEVVHHEYPHHHVALFAGVGVERDKNDHEENGSAFGLEYDIQFSDRCGRASMLNICPVAVRTDRGLQWFQ
jgi:hypothetical protein